MLCIHEGILFYLTLGYNKGVWGGACCSGPSQYSQGSNSIGALSESYRSEGLVDIVT